MLKTLTAKDVSYNAIFVSAFKALVIFELLLESPKTLDEIQAYLKTIPHIKANLTKDTLRIYLKTFQKEAFLCFRLCRQGRCCLLHKLLFQEQLRHRHSCRT